MAAAVTGWPRERNSDDDDDTSGRIDYHYRRIVTERCGEPAINIYRMYTCILCMCYSCRGIIPNFYDG